MTDKELIAEARRLENDYGDSYEVMTHMSALADALEASVARIAELEAGVTGRIVAASFEDGKTRAECGLEDCECPEHDWPVMPAGTYITVRLDEDCHVGLFRVRVHTLPVESEGVDL